jgi:hypothetical protein
MAPIRYLREEERELISSLLSGLPAKASLDGMLPTLRVTDMKDEGMGSIRFVQSEQRSFGKTLAEAQFVDTDGVLVSIAVNADTYGDLFEIDFWKVDFSPVRRYPRQGELSGQTLTRQ